VGRSKTTVSHRFIFLFLLTTARCVAGPDSIVTFNEVHYHPPTETEPEWIELHNQMAVRVDLGAWEIKGGIEFTFPEGTILEPGAFVVVSSLLGTPAGALGPFTGKLNNAGEEVRLHERHGRMMDSLRYEYGGKWPTVPDGEGYSPRAYT
jgi:hypothetical protein